MGSNLQNRRKMQFKAMENAHSAMGCFLYFVLLIVISVISISVCLFFAEKLFPRYVHIFNYSLSSRTFVELKAAHKYNAAVEFYEHKHDIFTTRGDKYINMIEVFDCYKRIGEYEKAEAILRDAMAYKYLSEKEIKNITENPIYEAFFKFGIAKELYGLYEEMDDIDGLKKSFATMQECYSNLDLNKIFDDLSEFEVEAGSKENIESLYQFYKIKTLYLDSPHEAISQLATYINDIIHGDESQYKPTFILRCMNTYNTWVIDQVGVMQAYTSICTAVEYANATDSFNTDKTEYGILSDICYRVHDIKNGRRFYSAYSVFLESTTSEDDPLYVKNLVRGFKYLEADGDWARLESNVIESCTHLRDLISKNILTMSESQREHFVILLEEPFGYAIDLLSSRPSNKLAELCFENEMYSKGLLLRSNREIANIIRNTDDAQLISKYEQLTDYRKELSYREGLGNIGNAIRISTLKKEIDALDKELAIACSEYQYAKESQKALSSKSVSRMLDKTSAIVEFIQTGTNKLIALVLRWDTPIQYVSLNSEIIFPMLQNDNRRTYTNVELTEQLWAPVSQYVMSATDIYYTTHGLFRSISLPALYTGNRSHLIDSHKFHLLSNASNIIMTPSRHDAASEYSIALWGDVDYGNKNQDLVDTEDSFRDIERGDGLHRLVFSGDEVDAIRDIIEKHQGKSVLYKGQDATEKSFRSRSGKRDKVLHVSTHGFFNEDKGHKKDYNPMYNAGLFFAGADSTWNRKDSLFVESAMLDDGILRADEIQYLDFSNCSLAVLSACKTGLGQSKNSEGIYGLQRAFKLAGVDKILMSLWNVDDRCTSDLMKEFYSNLYSGMTDEEALLSAQRKIREVYPSPEYWGAFVLLY